MRLENGISLFLCYHSEIEMRIGIGTFKPECLVLCLVESLKESYSND